jgi:protein O-GlcNAc transferase
MLETDPKVYTEKGLALAKAGRFEEAIKLYDMAINIYPDYIHAITNKFLALHNLTRYNEALDCLDDALVVDHKYVDKFSEEYLTDETISYYSYNLEWCSDYATATGRSIHSRWFYENGCSLHISNKNMESIKYFDKATELDPNNSDFWYGKGMALDSVDKAEDAKDCYKKAKELQSQT